MICVSRSLRCQSRNFLNAPRIWVVDFSILPTLNGLCWILNSLTEKVCGMRA